MAVSTSADLPSNIATFRPLGGDGKSSPFAMYNTSQSVAGAAGGGRASLILSMDQRYCCQIQYIGWTIPQVTGADVEMSVSISAATDGSSTTMGINGVCKGLSSTVFTTTIEGYWTPPPTILGPSNAPGGNPAIGLHFLNVDAQTYSMFTQILLWDIDVRNLTPYPLLVAASAGPGGMSHLLE